MQETVLALTWWYNVPKMRQKVFSYKHFNKEPSDISSEQIQEIYNKEKE